MNHTTLIDALLACNTPELLDEFLTDLLTPAERQECNQRLDIAHRLASNESYKHIEQETGASSTTIARVAKFLNRPGSGYQFIIKTLGSKTN